MLVHRSIRWRLLKLYSSACMPVMPGRGLHELHILRFAQLPHAIARASVRHENIHLSDYRTLSQLRLGVQHYVNFYNAVGSVLNIAHI